MDDLIKDLEDLPWYTKGLISIGLIASIHLLKLLDED